MICSVHGSVITLQSELELQSNRVCFRRWTWETRQLMYLDIITTSVAPTLQVRLVRCHPANHVHGWLCTTESTKLSKALRSAFSAHQHILDQQGRTRLSSTYLSTLILWESPFLHGILKEQATFA